MNANTWIKDVKICSTNLKADRECMKCFETTAFSALKLLV